MAIFSISHSETGKKLLNLKSPVDLSPIDTYECTSVEEISTGLLDDKRSIVWHQASNRLHAQKALLVALIRGFAFIENFLEQS